MNDKMTKTEKQMNAVEYAAHQRKVLDQEISEQRRKAGIPDADKSE